MSCRVETSSRVAACLALLFAVVDTHGQSSQRVPQAATLDRSALTPLHRLPVDFIENRGQWPAAASFVARRGQVAAAFERDAITLHLGASDPTRLGLVFEGSAPDVALIGEGKRATLYNYLLGNDPSAWRQRVPSYASLFYRGIYRGIDVRVRDDGG